MVEIGGLTTSTSNASTEMLGNSRGYDTDSDFGMPTAPLPHKTTVHLSAHLMPDAQPKRRSKRPGKDIRVKQQKERELESVSARIQHFVQDNLSSIEWRWDCSLREAMEKGAALMCIKDKNHGDEFFAVLFSGSDKENAAIQMIVDDPDVFPLIRHGGPWSAEPGLLNQKSSEYLVGAQRFLAQDWKYTREHPNLTLVWIIYNRHGVVVGRGGLQPEDDVSPPMTEPFVALRKEFWGSGLATTFFRVCLIPFYMRHAESAPMRILTLPQNKAAQKIANNTELPHIGFDLRGSVEAWGRHYDVYEGAFGASRGSSMHGMD